MYISQVKENAKEADPQLAIHLTTIQALNTMLYADLSLIFRRSSRVQSPENVL